MVFVFATESSECFRLLDCSIVLGICLTYSNLPSRWYYREFFDGALPEAAPQGKPSIRIVFRLTQITITSKRIVS
jgi:hypothetical protein